MVIQMNGYIVHETPKAYLFLPCFGEETPFWAAKSQITVARSSDGGEVNIKSTDWMGNQWFRDGVREDPNGN